MTFRGKDPVISKIIINSAIFDQFLYLKSSSGKDHVKYVFSDNVFPTLQWVSSGLCVSFTEHQKLSMSRELSSVTHFHYLVYDSTYMNRIEVDATIAKFHSICGVIQMKTKKRNQQNFYRVLAVHHYGSEWHKDLQAGFKLPRWRFCEAMHMDR